VFGSEAFGSIGSVVLGAVPVLWGRVKRGCQEGTLRAHRSFFRAPRGTPRCTAVAATRLRSPTLFSSVSVLRWRAGGHLFSGSEHQRPPARRKRSAACETRYGCAASVTPPRGTVVASGEARAALWFGLHALIISGHFLEFRRAALPAPPTPARGAASLGICTAVCCAAPLGFGRSPRDAVALPAAAQPCRSGGATAQTSLTRFSRLAPYRSLTHSVSARRRCHAVPRSGSYCAAFAHPLGGLARLSLGAAYLPQHAVLCAFRVRRCASAVCRRGHNARSAACASLRAARTAERPGALKTERSAKRAPCFAVVR
jgi:hypothetical protein